MLSHFYPKTQIIKSRDHATTLEIWRYRKTKLTHMQREKSRGNTTMYLSIVISSFVSSAPFSTQQSHQNPSMHSPFWCRQYSRLRTCLPRMTCTSTHPTNPRVAKKVNCTVMSPNPDISHLSHTNCTSRNSTARNHSAD